MASASQTAQFLRQRFLDGQGIVTQEPGPAAPSTRKFYSTHQGYDIAVPAGTPVNTKGLEYLGAYNDTTGYGTRAGFKDPQTGQTYTFSHLSNIQKTPEGVKIYTGGVPGTRGSGNTTGPHLDITLGGFKKQLGNLMSQTKRLSSQQSQQPQRKMDLQDIIGQLKAKAGGKRLVAYGSGKNLKQLQKIQEKVGGQLIKL